MTKTGFYEPTEIEHPTQTLFFSLKQLDANLVEVIVI